MRLRRAALSVVAVALYLAGLVGGVYTLLTLWVTLQTRSASAAVGTVASAGFTIFCLVVAKALSQRSDGIVGYTGDSDWGKVLGPR